MIPNELIFYKNDFQIFHIVEIFYRSNIFIVFLQDWGALKSNTFFFNEKNIHRFSQ